MLYIYYNHIRIKRIMANVHGFNDINNNNRPGRNNIREPMMAPADNEDALNQQIRLNKIPFMNAMSSTRPPLEQTIPYTLRLVWCPTLTIFTFTFFFLISIWVMYVVSLVSGGIDVNNKNYSVLAPYPSTLQKFGAINPSLIRVGEVWRLLTAAFLHVEILHIVMNSISILFFMSRLQKCYNAKLMILLALASAISGNITSATFIGQNTISVGASTVIYGCYGGLVAYMIINWKTLGRMRSQLCCIIGIILFISIFMSLGGSVDLAGHLGGLAGGISCGLGIFPGIKPKLKAFTFAGLGIFAAYILTMFLVFFLV